MSGDPLHEEESFQAEVSVEGQSESVLASHSTGEKAPGRRSPHVIFALIDDVGWNDLSFNNPSSPIQTPTIDALAHRGITLKQHYAHSLCTPSRAALLTGRYHVNTGLTYVLVVGTPVGLPRDIPTLPEQLNREGYHSAMVGKWHLGHGQPADTPSGRGFESFTGLYMWDADSFTKQMQEVPWNDPLTVDWVQEHVSYKPTGDGETERVVSFRHFAEPRHSTEAFTDEAEIVMREHAAVRPDQPLFLYVAFTAAHSPLQPLPQHVAKCAHINHAWRRDYCGMVMGVDEALGNLTRTAKGTLGDDVILVVSSDNGGSPWFGGNNAPLRGGKSNPFEGGVRVPAFITDLSHDQRHLGYNGPAVNADGPRVYNGLMHLSDWMPTLVSLARRGRGETAALEPGRFVGGDGRGTDGFDFVSALRGAAPQSTKAAPSQHAVIETPSPRDEVLLDMYFEDEFLFHEGLVALRQGRYKYVSGIVRDDAYYAESAPFDFLQPSNGGWLTITTETVVKILDRIFGSGPMDMLRITITHMLMHSIQARNQRVEGKLNRLFDLVADPTEQHNLLADADVSPELQQVVERMKQRVEELKVNRRPVLPAHMITPLEEWVRTTTVPGDCSMQPRVRSDRGLCRFTHPWVPDNMTDPSTYPGLISALDHSVRRTRDVCIRLGSFVIIAALVITFLRLCLGHIPKPVAKAGKKDKKKDKKKDGEGEGSEKKDKKKD